MQRDRHSGKILDDYGIPSELRNAVVETLDAYNQDYGRKGRDHLTEAVARTHYAFRRDYPEIEKEGPLAAADGLLVFSISLAEWKDICTEMDVFAKAESWSRRVHLHSADRTAKADPTVSLDQVRRHYEPDNRVAIVVEHP